MGERSRFMAVWKADERGREMNGQSAMLCENGGVTYKRAKCQYRCQIDFLACEKEIITFTSCNGRLAPLLLLRRVVRLFSSSSSADGRQE